MSDLDDLAAAARNGPQPQSVPYPQWPAAPPPRPLGTKRIWIVDRGDGRRRAMSENEVTLDLAAGKLPTTATVWQHGWPYWQPILAHFSLPPPPPRPFRPAPGPGLSVGACVAIGGGIAALLVIAMCAGLAGESRRPSSPTPAIRPPAVQSEPDNLAALSGYFPRGLNVDPAAKDLIRQRAPDVVQTRRGGDGKPVGRDLVWNGPGVKFLTAPDYRTGLADPPWFGAGFVDAKTGASLTGAEVRRRFSESP